MGDDKGPPDITGMVHHDDPHTSIEAAILNEARRTALHRAVLQALTTYGPLTDAELEELPEFRGFGPSTIRKRRSELYQDKVLAVVGERRNARNCKMLVWGLARPKRRSLYPPAPIVKPRKRR